MTILRIDAVKTQCGYRSDTSVYNYVREGLFTRPVPIGQRSVGWPQSEVAAIIAARVAGATETQLKQLVVALHGKRSELMPKV